MITRYSQRELIANMEVLAKKLTGRPVQIRFKELPSGPGWKAHGVAQRNQAGDAVIDLDVSTLKDINRFAETFTHELAHVVLHFWELPRRDIEQGVAREMAKQALHMSVPTTRGHPTVKKKEDEADALAARWMKIVNEHYWGHLSATGDPVMAVLKILYHKTGA